MKCLKEVARKRIKRIDFKALKKAGIERTLEDYYILGNYPPLILLEDAIKKGIDIFKGNKQCDFDIYIHFPFCESKCRYCHFYSIVQDEESVHRYLSNLKKEISLIKKRAGKVKARSVYIGGGTPNIMTSDQISGLIKHIRANFEMPKNIKFSMDISPIIVKDPDMDGKVRAMLENGVNRISIGGVELSDKTLRCQGRRHTVKDMTDTIDYLKKTSPRPQIATDMMIGVPNQTLETWDRTLTILIEKKVDCIMTFPLMFKASQPNWKDYLKTPGIFPSVKERAEMYMLALLKFREANYSHAPMHYFNRTSDMMHQQQLNKFETLDETGLLGIGASSFGFVNGYQYYNECTIGSYNARIENSELPVWRALELTQRQLFEREVMFRLFSRGVDKKRIKEKYGYIVDKEYAAVIRRLLNAGLLKSTSEYFRLTELGILFAEEVCDKFAGEDIRKKAKKKALVVKTKDPAQIHNYNMIGHRLR